MSDVPQGAGWWQASDGKWYPPELHPDATATPPPPAPGSRDPLAIPPARGAADASPAAPPGSGPPPGWYTPPPQPSGWTPPPGGGVQPSGGFTPPRSGSSNRTLWIVLAVIGGVFVLGAGGCAALVVGGTLVANDLADEVEARSQEIADAFLLDFSEGVPSTGASTCEVTGIQTDGTDDYDVYATVTNDSSAASAFRVDYELVGPSGELLGADYGVLARVEPGATARQTTIGVIDGAPDWNEVSCNVLFTTRLALE